MTDRSTRKGGGIIIKTDGGAHDVPIGPIMWTPPPRKPPSQETPRVMCPAQHPIRVRSGYKREREREIVSTHHHLINYDDGVDDDDILLRSVGGWLTETVAGLPHWPSPLPCTEPARFGIRRCIHLGILLGREGGIVGGPALKECQKANR